MSVALNRVIVARIRDQFDAEYFEGETLRIGATCGARINSQLLHSLCVAKKTHEHKSAPSKEEKKKAIGF